MFEKTEPINPESVPPIEIDDLEAPENAEIAAKEALVNLSTPKAKELLKDLLGEEYSEEEQQDIMNNVDSWLKEADFIQEVSADWGDNTDPESCARVLAMRLKDRIDSQRTIH